MFLKRESASAFRGMHGFESEPDRRIPLCPLGTLCEDFLKAAKVLRLNNPDGAASDESIQEAVG
jgi:hypothetical protein